jgi:hypothetical protein
VTHFSAMGYTMNTIHVVCNLTRPTSGAAKSSVVFVLQYVDVYDSKFVGKGPADSVAFVGVLANATIHKCNRVSIGMNNYDDCTCGGRFAG